MRHQPGCSSIKNGTLPEPCYIPFCSKWKPCPHMWRNLNQMAFMLVTESLSGDMLPLFWLCVKYEPFNLKYTILQICHFNSLHRCVTYRHVDSMNPVLRSQAAQWGLIMSCCILTTRRNHVQFNLAHEVGSLKWFDLMYVNQQLRAGLCPPDPPMWPDAPQDLLLALDACQLHFARSKNMYFFQRGLRSTKPPQTCMFYTFTKQYFICDEWLQM